MGRRDSYPPDVYSTWNGGPVGRLVQIERFVDALARVDRQRGSGRHYADSMTEASMAKAGFESEEPADITKDRWLQAQRDLITTTLDYNLQTIAALVADGRIDLSPSFQRRDRWDVKRKSLLIESFLMNVPLPPVFLNEDEYGTYSIIDGKQRLTTVSEFLNNRFKLEGLGIFHEANGLTFSELDYSLQSVLQTRASLRAIILLRMSDPLIKYHVFQRLNTGGVRLNSQEVRNVTFAGPLNDEIVQASAYPKYMELLGITESGKKRAAIWQHMRDVELVLRYLTLRQTWKAFSGSLGGAMNAYMADNAFMSAQCREEHLSDFKESVDKVYAAFGGLAFKRFDHARMKAGKQVLATLFDAQMIAVAPHSLEILERHSESLREAMVGLFQNEEFSRSIASQTNTPRFVRTRISLVSELVNRVVER